MGQQAPLRTRVLALEVSPNGLITITAEGNGTELFRRRISIDIKEPDFAYEGFAVCRIPRNP